MNSTDSDPQDASFPSTPRERGKIVAKTGLKVGANYARYLARRATGRGDAEASRRDLHDQNARDIFKELTKLRGTALKLAQGMSMDPGMLPDEFVEVMAQAQYSVPPMGNTLMRRQIKQGLGASPEDLFAEFEAESIAAASIGQVHRARLKDGRKVAVKVQYPNVRETIEADLRVARGIASRVVRGPVDSYIDEVRSMMLRETDYRLEGENIEHFARQYDDERIVTPRWVPELTSERVLTMTFVEGIHLAPFLAQNPSPEPRAQFAQLLWDFAHDQVASGNLTIHADFHPGNFLFREDGRLGVVDFGCVKTFPQDFMDHFLQVLRAQINDDEPRLRRHYAALDILRPGMKPDLAEKLFGFFHRMGSVISEPYRFTRFDFGDPSFGERIRDTAMEATTFREREAIGSPHFVFVNRVLFGLLAIMSQLGATIDSTHGFAVLNDAVDRIEARVGLD